MNITFKDVKLFDDNLSDLEIFKNVIDERGGEDPLHMLDLGDVLKKHQVWLQKLPRVIPHFELVKRIRTMSLFTAVKTNPDETTVKLLAALGGHFDCASKKEIMQVIGLGVPSDRIIFANPMKLTSHIEYAKKVGVALMTADHEDELKKIKKIYPEAKILIRIRCDAKVSDACLGLKFGCEPKDEAVKLIKTTMQLGLQLDGFCYHAGSPCGEVAAYCRGIYLCNNLIHVARSLGCKTANVIDIGGGIPGERGLDLDEYAGPINAALDTVDPSIKIIAEPGRYYVTSAFMAGACVVGKKVVMEHGEKTFMYYVTDGVYGTFLEELLDIKARHPVVINATREENEKYVSIVWGPTCDSYDCVLKDELLPEYFVGDWLAWYDIGAYGSCLGSEFNGYKPPKVHSVMRRSDWETMWTDISNQGITRRNGM